MVQKAVDILISTINFNDDLVSRKFKKYLNCHLKLKFGTVQYEEYAHFYLFNSLQILSPKYGKLYM